MYAQMDVHICCNNKDAPTLLQMHKQANKLEIPHTHILY